MRKQCVHRYYDIISLENLLAAWKEFLNGKRNRKDVQDFELRLMQHILLLYQDLLTKSYEHSVYEAFNISDPKPRAIHKASVRDRLLHHAIYRILYPFFDKTFIADSFSCRMGKGMHKATDRFKVFARKASHNHTKTVWVLKCDIRKFFASVDQSVLIEIIKGYIPDNDIVSLISEIIGSFHSTGKGVGLPLGNLTSQLLVNIYMNEFDQFMKHRLKAKYYIRYADDFVILSTDRAWLENLIAPMRIFLKNTLKLEIHPKKISIRTLASGVDYLGWVHFPDHRVLRTSTKKRMMRGIVAKKGKTETVQSYLGILSHGNSKIIKKQIHKITESLPENLL